ncbi:MAG TPA: hypothetical protein VF559_00310 [Caulobacteraceae bacterium]|jgi:pilus assembly protein CpaE
MSAINWKRRRILAVGPALASAAAQAFPDAALETIDPADLQVIASSPGAPDLVLLDADAADPAALGVLLHGYARQARQPAVLLHGAHLPAQLVRALFRLERSDVLESPVATADLLRAASALLGNLEPQAPPRTSHCWSVLSAAGGAGATTVAIETATLLADGVGKSQRVALVDLNLADGAAAAYLGVSGNTHLTEAGGAPDRIDAALLDAFAVKIDDCFDLFAAPRDPEAFARVTPEAVLRLMEVVCETYDWVVVDLPRLRQPWTLDVLSGSDEVVVVSELTVPALLSARALAEEIEDALGEGRRARLVVNRLASRMFGPAPSVAEAEKALQRKVDGGITSDWEAAACSVNLGGAISHHRPKSKIVKDVEMLIARLRGAAPRDERLSLRIVK